MKIRLLFVLALAAVAAEAQERPRMTGTWTIHNSIMGNENERTCTFTQKESEFNATCGGSATLSGRIDGDKVTWRLKSEYDGSPITLDYTGHFNSDGKIAGKVTVNEYNVEGEFTAVPATPAAK